MTQTRQESGFTSRQKAIAGAFVVIVAIIIWQIMGLFGGSKPKTAANANLATAKSPLGQKGTPTGMAANMAMSGDIPKPAEVPKAQPLTEREKALIQLQEQTEAQYLAALNELQMLKIEKEIAETNKAIAKAKLDTVAAQKDVVDLLNPTPTTVTPNNALLGIQPGQQTKGGNQQSAPAPIVAEPSYSVVSVTMLNSKWNAVLSYKGSLYQVSVGDYLPADNSRVLSIDKSGVVLEKTDGSKQKVSLVPII